MKTYLFSLPIICLSLGCAVSYNVGINGYSSSGQTLQIHQESSIYVVSDSNAPNPILENEIEMKIRKLINKNGNSIGTDEANYYLLFDYGMNSGQTVTDAIPIYHTSGYSGYPYSSFYSHGYTSYVPYSTVVYTRWLVLKLVDGKAYRISKKAKPLWIGEVVSAGTNSDLRESINYMLVAAFEHFGQDTGKRVNVLFLEDDERVKLLMER
ncbi:MAG: DUF4136 domain-containing protein [Planctomycetes bacterium]|nr:DUF4136 domain-containing protein [Planctomycetota bacterium]